MSEGRAGDPGLLLAPLAPLAPHRLRVEYRAAPRGVDVVSPRFSWALAHGARGQRQTACELTVRATSGAASGHVVWASGKVASNRSTNVAFGASTPLTPDTAFSWRVRWWDAAGAASPWSANATFSTGLRAWGEGGWAGAVWIGAPNASDGAPVVNPLLRHAFSLPTASRVARATAYVCGLGFYKLFLNGDKVSDHEMGQFSTFSERVYYDTHDVTAALNDGGDEHVVGVSLGPGWYAQAGIDAGPPSLLFRLSVDLGDGSHVDVVSDADEGTWRVAPGPVTAVDIYMGETYDAAIELPGWSTPGFDVSGWAVAAAAPAPSDHVAVSSHAPLPPIRVTETFPACDLWRVAGAAEPTWVFDFCQNMAGITTLALPAGVRRRANVTAVYGESLLGPRGQVNRAFEHVCNPTCVKMAGSYLTRGDGEAASYTTQFASYGFRYAQVTGWPGTPTKAALTAHFIHTDFDRSTGAVAFPGQADLNGVQRITRISARSNFMFIPTDCPQRERRGWLGDAQIASDTMASNFDVAGAYTAFLRQIADAQRYAVRAGQVRTLGALPDIVPKYLRAHVEGDPAWTAAFYVLLELVADFYDDDRVVSEYYPGLKAHAEQLTAQAKEDSRGGRAAGLLFKSYYSDWCPPKSSCAQCTPNSGLVSSYYYVQELRLVARFAAKLGEAADAARFAAQAAAVAAAFQRTFYDPQNTTYREPNRTCHEYLGPQTGIGLAAALGVVPAEDAAAVAASLVHDVAVANKGHVQAGIVGAKAVLPALSGFAGRADLALQMASTPTYPGWVFMVRQNATALWEVWMGGQQGPYHQIASWNHVMFGSQSAWYFSDLAGLAQAPGTRGWRALRLAPQVWAPNAPPAGRSLCAALPGGVAARLDTVRGVAAVSWTCDAGVGFFALNATVPVGSTASVVLPTLGHTPEAVVVREGGAMVFDAGRFVSGVLGVVGAIVVDGAGGPAVEVQVGSGSFEFVCVAV